MNRIEIYLLGVLTGLALLTGIILHQGKKEALPHRTTKVASMEFPTKYVSNMVWEELPYVRLETDRVEKLFNKYDVPYEYRDYTRSLCEIYNIDPLVFIRLIYRESLWGKASTYISYNEQRSYGQNKDIFDIGMGQLSSRYFIYFSTHHFDKHLLINLGYIRSTFNPEDDYSNLQVSASYLAYLLKKFNNDYNKAVMSYNAGETRIRRGDIPYSTIQYAQYIIKGEEC